MSVHISIAQLVPGYTSPLIAFTKRKAVACIVEMRLGCRNARGKGAKAARRAKRLSIP